MKRRLLGPRAVLEALAGPHARGVQAIYAAPEMTAHGRLAQAAARIGLEVQPADSKRLEALAGGLRHQGVVAIAGDYPYESLERILEVGAPEPLVVALDELTDPRNFGAIVRSAVAFGADGVVVPRHRSAPVTGVVVRASAGATEHARIARVTNLARTLGAMAERGLEVVGLDPDGAQPVDALGPAPGGRVLVIGSEGRGLRRLVRERCHRLVRIPTRGVPASLNAAVAAGIALYIVAGLRAGSRVAP
ncbi:MAG: 23S rRNA (guanosine(2251)-2'-O)-methyltransferase RlmB [Myxococcota bacterium]|nr:23S rRNA (guanosine(2251)-2'-O)-methyltransferase RlmB [Myxococcota bacterium]MDW8362016.1 23S rRNA (guanosine(2251)-2'-O)-methyltransferase RlmB [Myxococcales bacterium]